MTGESLVKFFPICGRVKEETVTVNGAKMVRWTCEKSTDQMVRGAEREYQRTALEALYLESPETSRSVDFDIQAQFLCLGSRLYTRRANQMPGNTSHYFQFWQSMPESAAATAFIRVYGQEMESSLTARLTEITTDPRIEAVVCLRNSLTMSDYPNYVAFCRTLANNESESPSRWDWIDVSMEHDESFKVPDDMKQLLKHGFHMKIRRPNDRETDVREDNRTDTSTPKMIIPIISQDWDITCFSAECADFKHQVEELLLEAKRDSSNRSKGRRGRSNRLSSDSNVPSSTAPRDAEVEVFTGSEDGGREVETGEMDHDAERVQQVCPDVAPGDKRRNKKKSKKRNGERKGRPKKSATHYVAEQMVLPRIETISSNHHVKKASVERLKSEMKKDERNNRQLTYDDVVTYVKEMKKDEEFLQGVTDFMTRSVVAADEENVELAFAVQVTYLRKYSPDVLASFLPKPCTRIRNKESNRVSAVIFNCCTQVAKTIVPDDYSNYNALEASRQKAGWLSVMLMIIHHKRTEFCLCVHCKLVPSRCNASTVLRHMHKCPMMTAGQAALIKFYDENTEKGSTTASHLTNFRSQCMRSGEKSTRMPSSSATTSIPRFKKF